MRILIFNWKDLKHPQAGGAEFITETAARHWAGAGHEVTLFTALVEGQPDRAIVEGVEIIRRGGRLGVYWQAYLYWKREGYLKHDLVIDEINTVPFFTPLYVKGPASWVPYFNQLAREIWFAQLPPPLSWLGYLLESLYLKLYISKPAVTISKSSGETLKDVGFPSYKLWPMFVDLPARKTFTPAPKSLFDKPVILYFGSLRTMKGVDAIICAFDEFQKTHPSALLRIAGGGSAADRDRLKRYVQMYGLEQSVQFLGRIAEKDKAKLFDECTLVTMASRREGWGLVITEAAVRCRPGVGYNTYGTKDAIIDGETGHLAKTMDHEGLANAWRETLKSLQHYEKLSRKAWKTATALSSQEAAQIFLSAACEIGKVGDPTRVADRDLPTLTVVTPTLNAARLLPECFTAIRAQDYPQEKIEIIVGDGGSIDGTQQIAKKFKATVLPNPLKTGEAGKAVGLKAARNELIVLLDSDNILIDRQWLRKMVAPFVDKSIVGSEPLYFQHRPSDGYLTRYTAMLGMGDPLVLFLGNYDRYSLLSGTWTKLDIPVTDCGGYLDLTLQPPLIPTIGANGTLFRRSFLQPALAATKNSDYLFDIDLLAQIADKQPVHFAKVKSGIVHVFAGTLAVFCTKQFRRLRDFLYYQRSGVRTYPWGKTNQWGRIAFILSCLTVVPLILQMLIGLWRKPDRAWLIHPVACYATLITYAYGLISFQFDPTIASRARWKQT